MISLTNRTLSLTLISFGCFFFGILFFAIMTERIIFRWPHTKNEKEILMSKSASKKQVTLHYFEHDAWHTEKCSSIWGKDPAENIRMLANQWFTLMTEEHIIKKSPGIESVLTTCNDQHAYISYNRTPFEKHMSTFEKWLIIEGLLKTIASNVPTITHIQFLLHHQPLIDTDLDFTNKWPVSGFYVS